MTLNLSASTWNYLCAYRDKADLAEAIGGISELGLGVELWLNWRADPVVVVLAPERKTTASAGTRTFNVVFGDGTAFFLSVVLGGWADFFFAVCSTEKSKCS